MQVTVQAGVRPVKVTTKADPKAKAVEKVVERGSQHSFLMDGEGTINAVEIDADDTTA